MPRVAVRRTSHTVLGNTRNLKSYFYRLIDMECKYLCRISNVKKSQSFTEASQNAHYPIPNHTILVIFPNFPRRSHNPSPLKPRENTAVAINAAKWWCCLATTGTSYISRGSLDPEDWGGIGQIRHSPWDITLQIPNIPSKTDLKQNKSCPMNPPPLFSVNRHR